MFIMEITRHFTASIFVVNNSEVLLHKHKKYDLILPVGGHIDRDELPSEAALREVKEETGLDVVLFNSNLLNEIFFENSIELNRGEHLNLHKLGPQHEHIDFVFYASSKSRNLNPQKGESREFYWYSRKDILNSEIISKEVKTYALEALEKLN